jgi:hypothetical protein
MVPRDPSLLRDFQPWEIPKSGPITPFFGSAATHLPHRPKIRPVFPRHPAPPARPRRAAKKLVASPRALLPIGSDRLETLVVERLERGPAVARSAVGQGGSERTAVALGAAEIPRFCVIASTARDGSAGAADFGWLR